MGAVWKPTPPTWKERTYEPPVASTVNSCSWFVWDAAEPGARTEMLAGSGAGAPAPPPGSGALWGASPWTGRRGAAGGLGEPPDPRPETACVLVTSPSP